MHLSQLALLAFAAAFFLIPANARAGQQSDVVYRFISEKKYAAAGPVSMRFVLRNQTGKTLRILKWNTLFEPISGNILMAVCDGAALPYIGPAIKRGAPSAEDYLTVAPSAEIEAPAVDLKEFYEFPASGACSVDITPIYLELAMSATAGSSGSGRISISGEPARFRLY